MKKVLLTFTFICTGCCLFAQLNKIDTAASLRKIRDYSRQRNARTASQNAADLIEKAKWVEDTARYSHKTKQGDVYHLSQDNMPCMRPDSTSYVYRMPVVPSAGKGPIMIRKGKSGIIVPKNQGAKMPNAYGNREIVFEKKP